ncbi:hypothetical protein AB0P15_28965 [Streptomyces sp. NPDC087917]|uniref:hypothetical protein n=1 Tax=Streptomyces sp. NPDC087917 TaxID=3155060 RepID=UPI0034279CF1
MSLVKDSGPPGPAGPQARPRWTAYGRRVLLCAPLNWFALLVLPLSLDRYVLFRMAGLALLVPGSIGVAVLALLPGELAERDPASRVDDVHTVVGGVNRLKQAGDVVLFIPAARQDSALASPGTFEGLTDIALTRTPVASGGRSGRRRSDRCPPRAAVR